MRVSQLALTASLAQPRVIPWKGGSKGGIAQIGMWARLQGILLTVDCCRRIPSPPQWVVPFPQQVTLGFMKKLATRARPEQLSHSAPLSVHKIRLEYLPRLYTMVNYNLQDELNPLLPKLLWVRMFYISHRRPTPA